MSGRDRDRDRGDRSSRSQQQAAARTNEYFVPKDGIDREVITADICRYLGNDALVRPGTYENPQTRVAQQGYFITAYRNLTTAMIADLKADSERWEAERRQTASRGQPQNVEYRSSTTHQSRQYYGPTEAAPPVQGAYPATSSVQQQGVYDNQYQSSTAYGQPATAYGSTAQGYASSTQGYGAAPQGYPAQEQYYVAGAKMEVDRPAERGTAQIPRSNTVQSYVTPTYQQQDTRGYYTQAGPSPVSSTQGYSQQPSDPFYGRAGTTYEAPTPEIYDRGYPDPRTQTYPETPSYSQASMPSTTSTTASSGSSRRERERDDRESSSRHHGRRR